jgi:outer membrane protein TolC
MMGAAALIFLCLVGARTLTLDEAVRSAEANQPLLREAHAATQTGDARADLARAPVLPQVRLGAEYRRTTGNREHKPGSATTVNNNDTTYNWWDFEANGNFILWDFGQTRGRWHSAEASARGLAPRSRCSASRASRWPTAIATWGRSTASSAPAPGPRSISRRRAPTAPPRACS